MALLSRAPKLTPADADAAYAAAQRVVDTHRRVSAWLRPGQTLAQIDAYVGKTLEELECKSCFLHYRVGKLPPFPSHACVSVNDCVVHGTAAYYLHPMKAGDLLKIDIGVHYKGWVGDAGWTYHFGEPTAQIRKLMECGKESLRRGIQQLAPGKTYVDWAKTVQGYVERECGFHLVRGLGGHGIGKNKGDKDRGLHLPPYVSNVVPTYKGEWPDAYVACEAGTLIAVEPMISLTTGQTYQKRSEWPVYTADGSMSVHYEHDVLITERGPRVLTEGMDELPDVVPV